MDAVAAEAHLFKPSSALRLQVGGGFFTPPHVGKNPPSGAIVYFHLKNDPKEKEEVALEFLDGSGKLIRKFSNLQQPDEAPSPFAEFGVQAASQRFQPKAGLNRFVWNLRYPDASRFRGMILWAGNTNGPTAVPGTYQVRLSAAGKTLTESFEVQKDPRVATTQAEFQKQFELHLKIRDKLTEVHDSITRIRDTRDQVKAYAERAKGNKAIGDAAKALGDKLTAVEEALYQTKNQSNQDPLNFPIRLNNKLASLAGVIASTDSPPTDQSHAVYDDLVGKIDAELAKLKTAMTADLAAFNQLVRDQNVPAVMVK
jgi:hypothetical protein